MLVYFVSGGSIFVQFLFRGEEIQSKEQCLSVSLISMPLIHLRNIFFSI